jgi:hypothetical protein
MSTHDQEHGYGWGPQAFERTDVTIPAGTDWSDPDTGLIGRVSVDPMHGGIIFLMMELEEASADTWYLVWRNADDHGFVFGAEVVSQPTDTWFGGPTAANWTPMVAPIGLSVLDPSNPLPAKVNLEAVFYTGSPASPTTEEAVISRVRASILTV